MTIDEIIKILESKAECMRRESSGINQDCNYRNCADCELCYAQGTTGEQIEALQMASKALREQNSPSQMSGTSDSISRQSVSDLFDAWEAAELDHHIPKILRDRLKTIPSAQPELTDDRAIEHLQSTGWMQNHDKEMYEMGLRERIADDSGNYDSLIPSGDTILRQNAIDAVDSETVSTNPEHFRSSEKFNKFMDDADIASFGKWKWAKGFNTALVATTTQLEKLPSAQPEPKTAKWINNIYGIPICSQCGYKTPYDRAIDDYEYGNFCPNCGARMEE